MLRIDTTNKYALNKTNIIQERKNKNRYLEIKEDFKLLLKQKEFEKALGVFSEVE